MTPSPAVSTSVHLGSLTLKNPVMTASGTFGSGKQYADFIDLSALGALVTKGVSLEPWSGNSGVRVYETPSGMLNSIGLQNPGVEAFIADDLAWLREHAPDATVIVNVSGHTRDEYVQVIERLAQEDGIAAYEVNISCPNVDRGGLAFGTDPDSAAAITRACKEAAARGDGASTAARAKRPVIVKLSPNVTDIAEIARACEDAGADALALINTILGTAINIQKRTMVFERTVAGLSGPAIKPVALRMVWQVARAVSIPLVGMGGIATPDDAIEFLLAGATAVAVGTGNFIDPTLTVRCIERIEEYAAEQGFSAVEDMIGALERRDIP
ncbi:MAG: dihydroorotate dehydrogenase [Coriobacteriia bacterium]|nr:dihydroorotate dehydrogenase [Coriobacteriia bacterium]